MKNMANYLEIAEEELQKIKARRRLEKTADGAGLPWPSYNGGRQFHCDKCGANFDTSAAIAKHRVYGCEATTTPMPVVRTLPSCSACGSFALCRLPTGDRECQTCQNVDRGPTQ
jgi:hypothetical protein